MLAHLLVPLDGSKLAEEALIWAQEILQTGGRITLLSAVELPEVVPVDYYPTLSAFRHQAVIEDVQDYTYWQNKLFSSARDYLNKLSEGLTVEGRYQVDVIVQAGDPANVIVKMARDCAVDAIVMSTHGRSGISRLLFGSVGAKVLSAGVCPVFLIPSKAIDEKRAAGEIAASVGAVH
jgi:nucleotide-binding universal stress UspA family protein